MSATATTTTTVPESLLSELERQDLTLSELPKNYTFPLFSGRQAVESQRRSGYRTTARAAREVIDNAYEAGAKNVWVIFRRYGEDPKHDEGHKDNSVSAVAFIDDGPGMSPPMARYALTWGGGTHTKKRGKIGRFGFGLPNSGINQTRLLEVYTKTPEAQNWTRAVLDIRNPGSHELLTIPEPAPASLPEFVQKFLKAKGIALRSGTVVVWEKPDRLTYRKSGTLKEHLINDFGVVYRGLLDSFNLFVVAGPNDITKVDKVDPLFLTPGAKLYKSPEEGGALCTVDRELAVKFYRDEETGEPRLEKLDNMAALETAKAEPNVEAVGVLKIRVARFPYGFVLGRPQFQGKDEYKRFTIRKPRKGMSFVRSGREIDTIDAFPKGSGDESKGLGEWPTLESYAYHWGIEVHFGPELDDVFALGNDKQTIHPIEDFWRVLSSKGVELDVALKLENKEQHRIREKRKQEEAAAEISNDEIVTPAIEAASQAAQVMGRVARLPEERRVEARQRHEEEIKSLVEERGLDTEAAHKALEAEAKRKPYAIKLFEADGGVFYKPDYGNGMQKVVLLNKAHPFFQNFYTYLRSLPDARARNAVDILLFALADGELGTEGPNKVMYEHQREQVWSAFLKIGLKFLDQVQPADDDEEDL